MSEERFDELEFEHDPDDIMDVEEGEHGFGNYSEDAIDPADYEDIDDEPAKKGMSTNMLIGLVSLGAITLGVMGYAGYTMFLAPKPQAQAPVAVQQPTTTSVPMSADVAQKPAKKAPSVAMPSMGMGSGEPAHGGTMVSQQSSGITVQNANTSVPTQQVTSAPVPTPAPQGNVAANNFEAPHKVAPIAVPAPQPQPQPVSAPSQPQGQNQLQAMPQPQASAPQSSAAPASSATHQDMIAVNAEQEKRINALMKQQSEILDNQQKLLDLTSSLDSKLSTVNDTVAKTASMRDDKMDKQIDLLQKLVSTRATEVHHRSAPRPAPKPKAPSIDSKWRIVGQGQGVAALSNDSGLVQTVSVGDKIDGAEVLKIKPGRVYTSKGIIR